MRRILHVFHGRHSAAHGAADTPPLDVSRFRSADVAFWRGQGGSPFGYAFEESTDQVAWALCAGADPDRDPGAGTEDHVRLVFRRPYLRLRADAQDLTSLWAVAGFDPDPLFGEAPRGIETSAADLGGHANNLVLVEDSGQQYAFVSLGTDGIAIVRADDLGWGVDLVHLATIADSTLGGTLTIAGGSSDALAVFDGLLVSLAVGSGRVDANGHGVTVFDAPTAVSIAEAGSPFDFSSAYIARTGDNVIAAPGNGDGKGAGVDGASGRFFVATGGTGLAVATINTGPPVTYTVQSPVSLASDMSHVVDVRATATHALVSGQKTGSAAHAVRTIAMDPSPSANSLVDIAGRFDYYGGKDFTGPGNFACDLSLDAANDVLYAGAIDRIARFDVSDLDNIAELEPVPDAGVHLVGVHGSGTVLVALGDFELRVFAGAGGRFRPQTRTPFGEPNRILAAATLAMANADYVLVAAGHGGLRAVRYQPLY